MNSFVKYPKYFDLLLKILILGNISADKMYLTWSIVLYLTRNLI